MSYRKIIVLIAILILVNGIVQFFTLDRDKSFLMALTIISGMTIGMVLVAVALLKLRDAGVPYVEPRDFPVNEHPGVYRIDLQFENPEKMQDLEKRYRIQWFDEYPFDFRYPFREIVDRIHEELLKEYAKVTLKYEHPYSEHEDFVTFCFRQDGETVEGYFEHSLCYIEFYHRDKNFLNHFREIANRVQFESKGYEGDLYF